MIGLVVEFGVVVFSAFGFELEAAFLSAVGVLKFTVETFGDFFAESISNAEVLLTVEIRWLL